MNRKRRIAAGTLGFGALALIAIACGGGDDNAGDDSSGNDSGPGKDSTVDNDSGPPADTGAPETGPFCNTTPCVTEVAAGGTHNCALISDGTVRCWGSNLYGELGSGTVIDGGTVTPNISAAPIAVTGLSDVVSLAGGGYFSSDLGFTCAIHTNKTLDCWGADVVGELGRGDAAIPSGPTPGSTLLTSAVEVSAGYVGACAVLVSGDITCWGDNAFAQFGPAGGPAILASPTVLSAGGNKYTHVSIGYDHICAVTDDGHVWCWGVFSERETGHITDGGVQDLLPAQVPGLDSVIGIAAGYESTCALKSDGSVLCFGLNLYGLLGRATDASTPFDITPTAVTVPAGTQFKQLTAHIADYCALDTNGDVWCWGYNQNGQAGTGTLDAGVVVPAAVTVPTKIDGLSNVDQIAAGSLAFHGCALIHGGAVKCWGTNAFSELGYATPDGGLPFSIAPVTITF